MKSKFNWLLLLLCFAVLWVPAVLFLAMGVFYQPLAVDINTSGIIFSSLPNYNLDGIWHSYLVFTYVGGIALMTVMTIVWVLRQAFIKNAMLPNVMVSMWLKYIMISVLAVIIVSTVGITVLLPLKNPAYAETYWPWLALIVQAAAFLPLQRLTHPNV